MVASANKSLPSNCYRIYYIIIVLVFNFAHDSVARPPLVKQSDGEGLSFEPRTLVSYTISGGMGFEKPNVLLQAVVFARGDGPACVMPPPIAPHEGEEEGMSGQCTVDPYITAPPFYKNRLELDLDTPIRNTIYPT